MSTQRKINKVFPLIILSIGFLLQGCASLPSEKLPPQTLTSENAATIQLVRENVNSWWSLGDAALVEIGDYRILVKEEWEDMDGVLKFRKVKFNNNAKFMVPAGTYPIRLFILTPVRPKQRVLLKTDPYELKIGKNYKLHIFADCGSYEWKASIAQIEEVK